MSTELDNEIDRNLFAFLPRIPQLIADHEGEFALLRHQELVSLHKRLRDALDEASNSFSDGIFSIQQVTDKPVELGFFSYADHSG
jgi:hypothetical protein